MIEPILSHENLRHVITWINNGPWLWPAVAKEPGHRGTRRESLKIKQSKIGRPYKISDQNICV